MALVLCVKVNKSFYIEDTPVRIKSIEGPTRFVVSVSGVDYTLTDEESVVIYPQVRASCGSSCPEDFVKVILEAPRSIVIEREHIYRQRNHDSNSAHKKSVA